MIHLLDSRITRNRSGYFAYTLSKKILADFTKMAALELAPRIRVNALAPGLLLPSSREERKLFETLSAALPLKKSPTLKSFLTALDFLIDTPDVTGQIVFIDGGQNL